MHALDLGPFLEARAWGVSDGPPERIVGMAMYSGGYPHAILWIDGVATDLQPALESPSLYSDVNADGVVVGTASPGGPFRLDTRTNQVTYLNPPGEPKMSVATAVNAAGHVVGQPNILYDGATMHDLGDGLANDINDSDVVVGSSFYAPGTYHAFRWTSGEGMQDIHDNRSGDYSVARAVNNAGDIVGETPFDFDGRGWGAFLYRDGKMHNLNDLIPAGSGWTLEYARDINDAGQIVGYGHTPAGQQHGFLLTPPSIFHKLPREDLDEVIKLPRDPPPPDPGPLAQILARVSDLPPAERDLLLGLAISELAGQLDDSEGREGLQATAAEVARRAAERLSEEEERS